MRARRFIPSGLALLAGAAVALSACRPPRYVRYSPPGGDFSCDVPWGWSVFLDSSGGDYSNAVFTGPFQPEFYRGIPSLSVRWYALNAPHRLPDGGYEMYASWRDFLDQMLRQVYGPDGMMKAGSDKDIAEALASNERVPDFERVRVSGEEAVYLVMYRALPAPSGQAFGVARDERGERVVEQRHGYVLLPRRGGFYVLTYPATRDGFEKHRPAFFRLINTFKALKSAGPRGPASRAR